MLRDAWEGMVIRDIATAGGVDPRQVSSSYWDHAKNRSIVRGHRHCLVGGRATPLQSSWATLPFAQPRVDAVGADNGEELKRGLTARASLL